MGWRRGRAVLAGAAALCAVAALPGRSSAATPPDPYAFATGAPRVDGAGGTADAVPLDPGRTYRSSVGGDGAAYYRLRLDATSTAYVSATAVPAPGTRVAFSDGLKVSVQDADGHSCFSGDSGQARFGPTESPRPLTAWASRRIGPGAYSCQTAGTYYVLVERVGEASSSPDDWDLELRYVSEPGLRGPVPTQAPETWDSASPEPVDGTARARGAGAGFEDARALGRGVWRTDIAPGRTLFYRVPVAWGQQVHATAELASASGGDGFLGSALVMSLYNPARAFVDDAGTGYDGRQKSASLKPLPAVAYENRYAASDRVGGMRFAGWYYLTVHLAEATAGKFGDGPFGLTLRVRVDGTGRTGPAYAGNAAPQGVFEVTEEDLEDASDGTTASGAGDGGTTTADGGDGGDGAAGGSTAMKLVAASGIGTGSLLVLGLVVWTVAARRRTGG